MPAARRAAPAGPADGSAPVDRTLLFSLIRLVNLAARPFQEGLGRRHGIGLAEWRALAVLSSRPATTASEIAQRTGLDKMTVSRALGALERGGRIVRRPDPDDGRRALVSLTAAGRRLFEALWKQARGREEHALAGLTEAERTRLARLVDRMSDALLAADGADGALSDARTGRRAAKAADRPAAAARRSSAPAPRPSRAPSRRTGTRG
ncbi:MAG TPA: MarR family transcriptional regulator [Burkholderiaceae bacterium]|nr:MarR family transcriptional regulator [Burkholderiaceae bacterium]